MIVDEGSQLACRHAAQDADLLIDPGIGNWDFFADHITQHELACAGEAILRSDGLAPNIYNGLNCVLGEMICDMAGKPGVQQYEVSVKVRAFGYQSMAYAMHLNLDVSTDTRAGWLALALFQEDAGRFAVGTPSATTSVRLGLTTSPRSVLFLNANAGVNDGACHSVQAAIDCVSRIEVDAGREVQIVRIHSASVSGTRWRDVSRSPVPWRERAEGRC